MQVQAYICVCVCVSLCFEGVVIARACMYVHVHTQNISLI